MRRPVLPLFWKLCMVGIVSLLLIHEGTAQPTGTSNFLTSIKNYNLATLWRADRLKIINSKGTDAFPEPLGIIGKNCQRFYIHYTSVVKDAANPYRYNVKGKTRVGNQVKQFAGTITVTQAGIYKPGNNPCAPEAHKGYKRGKTISRVLLTETTSATGIGTISGELTTEFCIDSKNNLNYDTLDYGIDGYANNQFTGSWTAKSSKFSQRLLYGDISFQDDRFADVYGITVPPEFEKYGWQSFVNAISDDIRPASKAAIAEEKRQWWK